MLGVCVECVVCVLGACVEYACWMCVLGVCVGCVYWVCVCCVCVGCVYYVCVLGVCVLDDIYSDFAVILIDFTRL